MDIIDTRLTNQQLRIIGAEFTVDLPDGTNQELEMFTPSGLLILPRGNHYTQYFPKITFHTTIGDYSIGGRNQGGYCPW